MGYDKYGLNWSVWGNDGKKKPGEKRQNAQQAQPDRKKEEKKPVTGIEETPEQPEEKPQPEYRIKDLRIITPPQGFRKDAPFDIEGEVENIRILITRPRILLYPVGRYKGQEDLFVSGGIDACIDTATHRFTGTCRKLRDPESFARDDSKTADATWELVVRAEGNTAERPFESKPLTFPLPDTFQVLQKIDYDEHGAMAYGKPQSGKHFKSNGIVKALQKDLITTGFLIKNSDDGYFGDQTDKAVNAFQEFAIKPERMKRKIGKIEITDKKLEQAQPDGVVGKKTRDELDRWIQNDYIRPVPVLRYNDYDTNGVKNGKGKEGTEEFHDGTPVTDLQKDLKNVGLYQRFKDDGYFFGKTKSELIRFQDAAAKGEFAKADNTRVGKAAKKEIAENVELKLNYAGAIPHIAAKAENTLKAIMKEQGLIL